MEKVTRQHQLSIGKTRYFTGKPCIHGHVAERFTASGACVACIASKQTSARKARIEFERRQESYGVKLRPIPAHDDDWPILEALAADMAAERERVYLIEVGIPLNESRRDIVMGRPPSDAAKKHADGVNARINEMMMRELGGKNEV